MYSRKTYGIMGNLDVADNEVDDTDWDEIHVHNFKCSIDTCLRSFYIKFFHKAIALTIFYLRSTAKIPLIVIFVINFQNLSFIFSVNVIFLDLFGKSCSKLLKTNTMLNLLHQILIRFLEFLETIVSDLFYFCDLHITFTPVNFKIKIDNCMIISTVCKWNLAKQCMPCH